MVTTTPLLDRLFEMVDQRAYREGDFTLASGKKSTFYFDSKPILLDGEGSRVVARIILHEIARRDLRPAAVGGMELGAVPIACAVSALSPEPAPRVVIVRKKPKAHGTGQAIEGRLERGDRVVVVEDVVTTGESTWKALQAIEGEGAVVVGIFALMDRQEGHLPEFDRYADRFFPLLTIGEFRQRRAAKR
jgi:orotate phosphoribosyltransferase